MRPIAPGSQWVRGRGGVYEPRGRITPGIRAPEQLYGLRGSGQYLFSADAYLGWSAIPGVRLGNAFTPNTTNGWVSLFDITGNGRHATDGGAQPDATAAEFPGIEGDYAAPLVTSTGSETLEWRNGSPVGVFSHTVLFARPTADALTNGFAGYHFVTAAAGGMAPEYGATAHSGGPGRAMQSPTNNPLFTWAAYNGDAGDLNSWCVYVVTCDCASESEGADAAWRVMHFERKDDVVELLNDGTTETVESGSMTGTDHTRRLAFEGIELWGGAYFGMCLWWQRAMPLAEIATNVLAGIEQLAPADLSASEALL